MGSVDENQQRLQNPSIENHFPRSGLSILPIGSSESSSLYHYNHHQQIHRNDSKNSNQSLKDNFMRMNESGNHEENEQEKESSMPLSSMISPKRPFVEKSGSNDSDFSAGFDNTNHQLPYDSSSSDNSTIVNSRHPSLRVNSNNTGGGEGENSHNNGISPSISNFPSEDFDESHYFHNHSLSVSNMNLNDSDLIIPNIPSFDPNDHHVPSSSSALDGIEIKNKKDETSFEGTLNNSLSLSNHLPPPPPEAFSQQFEKNKDNDKNDDSDSTVDNNIDQQNEIGRKRLESDASNLGTIRAMDSSDPMSFTNIDVGIHEYATILYRFIDLSCIHSEILQLQVGSLILSFTFIFFVLACSFLSFFVFLRIKKMKQLIH
jgi:hypothetical protein